MEETVAALKANQTLPPVEANLDAEFDFEQFEESVAGVEVAPPQQQVRFHRRQSAVEQVQQAQVMFMRYDADKSGSIDAKELQLLLADMGSLEVDPAILERHVTDKTCTYDFDQFVALYNELCGGEALIHNLRL